MQNPNSGTLTSGVLASAFVIILAWVLSLQGVTVPADIQVAMTTLVAYATSFLVHAKPDADPTASKGFTRSETAALLAGIGLVLLMAACAADGSFASKTKPIDPAVTFTHICSGEKIGDALWQSAVVAAAGRITAADVQVEKDFHAGALAICSGPVPADLNGAIAAVIADSAQISVLVAKYTKPATP